MLVTMLRIVVGVVRITTVVQGTARGFKQIIYCSLIHAVWQDACGFLVRGQGDQRGAVKGVQRVDFNVFNFYHVAWLHDDAALFRHAPANPEIHAGLRPDKRHVVRTVLHHRCRHVYIDVIVMIVGGKDGVDLANGKRIKNKRRGTQVWLQFFYTCHALHLMTFFHQRIAVALLAGAAPEINANIGATLGFQPDAGATQPPHCKRTRSNLFLLNLFIQPAAPFRESAQNP